MLPITNWNWILELDTGNTGNIRIFLCTGKWAVLYGETLEKCQMGYPFTCDKNNEICYNSRRGRISGENTDEFSADKLPFEAAIISAKEKR